MKFESKSSHISGSSYDPDKKQLSITFKNGDVYNYHNVSLEDYNAFKHSESHGKYFHNNIKNKFEFTKGTK
jgi:hypothetical protein